MGLAWRWLRRNAAAAAGILTLGVFAGLATVLTMFAIQGKEDSYFLFPPNLGPLNLLRWIQLAEEEPDLSPEGGWSDSGEPVGRLVEPDEGVAAIGSGHIFVGPDLSPAKEELLVDTCNWLLGRDTLLRRADKVWSFPRVSLSPREHTMWNWGAWFGLPSLSLYLGLVVLMGRRLR